MCVCVCVCVCVYKCVCVCVTTATNVFNRILHGRKNLLTDNARYCVRIGVIRMGYEFGLPLNPKTPYGNLSMSKIGISIIRERMREVTYDVPRSARDLAFTRYLLTSRLLCTNIFVNFEAIVHESTIL